MMKLLEFKAGDIILKEGELGESAFVIEKGEVEVSKDLNGRKIHLAFMGAGEIFGEMGMIEEKPRRDRVTEGRDRLRDEETKGRCEREGLFRRALISLPELAETNISPGQMSDQFKLASKRFYDAA
jgi:signal-transduction protein with cAMP-binding, CBS, and nucleotidyltransferase domain